MENWGWRVVCNAGNVPAWAEDTASRPAPGMVRASTGKIGASHMVKSLRNLLAKRTDSPFVSAITVAGLEQEVPGMAVRQTAQKRKPLLAA
jgi:hypothetical protein